MSHLPQTHERAHPGPLQYIAIAAVLTIITILEVAIFYIPAVKESGAFVPVLLLLSATKFSLVVMFYMHLKFDHRLFSTLFMGGLWLAISVVVALLALFQAFVR